MLTSGEGRGPSTHAARVLQQGLEYLGHGWQLVPTFGISADGRCTCGQAHVGSAERTRGKHPIQRAWQTQPITDDEQLQSAVERWPLMNVGVLLGPGSGVVDIEWDDEAGKETAQRLGLTKIITPTYRSGRSEHRLFRWDERLPKSAVAKVAGLEIRIGGDGRGSQSILPPSRHWAGGAYEWLAGLGPDETDAAPVPDEVLELIRLGGGPGPVGGGGIWDHGETIRTGPTGRTIIEQSVIEEGGRNDTLFRGACGIARKMIGLEQSDTQAAFFEVVRGLATKCKPPLEDEEVESIARSALKYGLRAPTAASRIASPDASEAAATKITQEQLESATGGTGGHAPQTWADYGLRCEGGVWYPGDWTLVSIMSNPTCYRLHVPAWVELTDDQTGDIIVSAAEYASASKMSLAIQNRVRLVCLEGKDWTAVWHGSKKQPSLRQMLLQAATSEAAPPEMMVWLSAAEYLLRLIESAPSSDEPDESGVPVWVDDVCWLNWAAIFDAPVQQGRFVKLQVSELFSRLGMMHRPRKIWPEVGQGRKRYYGLDRDSVLKIRSLLLG